MFTHWIDGVRGRPIKRYLFTFFPSKKFRISSAKGFLQHHAKLHVNGKHTSHNFPLISWQPSSENERETCWELCVLNADVVPAEMRNFAHSVASDASRSESRLNFPTRKQFFRNFKLNKLFSLHSISSLTRQIFEIFVLSNGWKFHLMLFCGFSDDSTSQETEKRFFLVVGKFDFSRVEENSHFVLFIFQFSPHFLEDFPTFS